MRVLRFEYGLCLIGLLLTLFGCTTMQNMSANDTEILKERANLRWQALLKKDWESAYAYELPAYRSTHDVKQFSSKFGSKVLWKEAKVTAVDITKDSSLADVKVLINYEIRMSDGEILASDKTANERWIKQENQWWFSSSE